MTGIIGAMQIEVDALRAKVKNAVIRRISGIEFVAGTLFGKDVVIARSGVGKVFAAVCAQTMILEFGVRRISIPV
jgi:adenosylhomocysteine nucleosidase